MSGNLFEQCPLGERSEGQTFRRSYKLTCILSSSAVERIASSLLIWGVVVESIRVSGPPGVWPLGLSEDTDFVSQACTTGSLVREA